MTVNAARSELISEAGGLPEAKPVPKVVELSEAGEVEPPGNRISI
jgi:hypothetical protein